MRERPWHLDAATSDQRQVRRAALLAASGVTVLLLDADDGAAARLSGLPPTGSWPVLEPLTLSPDGRHLLFACQHGNGPQVSLVSQTLATGDRRQFPTPVGCFDQLAAVSPDERTIASLTNDDRGGDGAAIDLVAVATADRRRLWSAEGNTADPEAAIAWSPDGRLIAASYRDMQTDETATVVIEVHTGSVVAHHEHRILRGCPNATWVDDSHLVLMDIVGGESPYPLYLVDVHTGDTRRLAPLPRHTARVAFFDGQAIVRSPDGRLHLADLDGNDSRPLVTLSPSDLNLGRFDVVPSLLLD
jgi:hypothetical protein